MDALRISASDLDAFRYYRQDEEADLASLLARLRREEPPSPAMLAGTALHKALETAAQGDHDEISADGYTFVFPADAVIDLPDVRECKATKDYAIDGVTVTLVGKVDAIHGRRIDDHKFTSRADLERFMGSAQWKAYLDIFDADEFRWNIFEGRETEAGRYVVSAVHSLTTHRYPGMEGDLRRELALFVEFAREHLPERFEARAAA